MADDKETYTDETFTRVYNDQTGDYWQIGPDRDALGLCEVSFYAKGNFNGLPLAKVTNHRSAVKIVGTK